MFHKVRRSCWIGLPVILQAVSDRDSDCWVVGSDHGSKFLTWFLLCPPPWLRCRCDVVWRPWSLSPKRTKCGLCLGLGLEPSGLNRRTFDVRHTVHYTIICCMSCTRWIHSVWQVCFSFAHIICIMQYTCILRHRSWYRSRTCGLDVVFLACSNHCCRSPPRHSYFPADSGVDLS